MPLPLWVDSIVSYINWRTCCSMVRLTRHS